MRHKLFPVSAGHATICKRSLVEEILCIIVTPESDCSPAIFISKVESAQFGNPLARFLHINRDLSQGPWVGVAQTSNAVTLKLVLGI